MTFTECQIQNEDDLHMFFNETLKIDDDFKIDEENNLFGYRFENKFIVSSSDNIESCVVMADLDSIDKSCFTVKAIEGIGTVHFVRDERNFAKAVMQTNAFLTICFYDKENELRCFRKLYDSQNEEVYALSARINKLIAKNHL